jgi:hypothetical protein
MLIFEKNVFHVYFCNRRATFRRWSQNQCSISILTYVSQKPVLNNNKTWIRNVDLRTISHTVLEVYLRTGSQERID